MRIGIFTDLYLPRIDGVAISVESFRVGLESLGHTVYVFCPKLPEPFTEPNDRIYRFPSLPSITYDGFRETYPFTPGYINLINSLQLDVIHTFTQFHVGMFGSYIAKHNHIPLVTTCGADFDLIIEYKRINFASLVLIFGTMLSMQKFMTLTELNAFLKPSYPFIKWLHRMIRLSAAFYNDQCDLTIVPSLKLKRSIAPYMKKEPVILASGIDLRLVPSETDSVQSRKKYGLRDKILFVSSSRLVREKRIDFLIRAFAHMPQHLQEKSALVLVGDGPAMPSLKKIVEDLGLSEKVIFIGRVTNQQVLEIVSACDVYIHASLRETQGLVLNEAAACGKPIIMIDREVNEILHEGENGFFADNTLSDFSSHMAVLAKDNEMRHRFGKKSKEFAQETSFVSAAKELVQLYTELIAGKKNSPIPSASLQEVLK